MGQITALLSENIISVLLVMSALFGALVALMPRGASPARVKGASLVLSAVVFTASLYVFFAFDPSCAGMQFVEKRPWIPSFNVNYSVGVDGISLFLVMLTTLLTPLIILTADAASIKHPAYYFSLYFFLEFTMIGALAATDMVLFYAFWELMLVPMYLIIGCWGGPNRVHAAVKFFIYTVFGSVFMLFAIFALVNFHAATRGSLSFDIASLYNLGFDRGAQLALFCFMSIAFMVKVPLFPFHTWLPHAHVEAPTGGSVILAAVLLKMGTYGFLRFSIPMFPLAAKELSGAMMFLGAFGVLYGALMSYAQTDMKKLIAYSSVSHLGAVTAGIFALNPEGVSGSILQMINHGVSTGALFMLVGVIYDRRHTRELDEFGGLAARMPLYSTIFAITTFSSIGLPGLNGFTGEFLILAGAFGASWGIGALAATGVVLGAVYMLMVYERMFLGKTTRAENEKLEDLTPAERFGLAPLVLLMFWIGIYPAFITERTDKAVTAITAPFARPRATTAANVIPERICQKNR